MKTLKDIDISNKMVFIRVDFNVPLDEEQRITDDSRIEAVLPTLRYLREHGAKIVAASHLGRPKGKRDDKLSLAPAARRLGELLGVNVKTAPDCIGQEVEDMKGEMSPGEVLLLENLRFHPEEKENDEAFAKKLVSDCDIYVNDAFAVSHRENASVHAVTKHVPVCAAGFLLEKEIRNFEKAMDDPSRPLAAVIGGAKVSDKLGALETLLKEVDKLIIGGAMANTFLKSLGFAVGESKVEMDLVDEARNIVDKAREKGVRLYLPVDAVVAKECKEDAQTKKVTVYDVPENWQILDIGPASVLYFSEALDDARTIVWNGPMGVFEMDAFSRGTIAIAHTLANSHALTIVGGGDSSAAVDKAGMSDRMSYISTGGGAFLQMLERKPLPGVTALEKD